MNLIGEYLSMDTTKYEMIPTLEKGWTASEEGRKSKWGMQEYTTLEVRTCEVQHTR